MLQAGHGATLRSRLKITHSPLLPLARTAGEGEKNQLWGFGRRCAPPKPPAEQLACCDGRNSGCSVNPMQNIQTGSEMSYSPCIAAPCTSVKSCPRSRAAKQKARPQMGTGLTVRGTTPVPSQIAGRLVAKPPTLHVFRVRRKDNGLRLRRRLLARAFRPLLRRDLRRLRVHLACTIPGSLQNVPTATHLHQSIYISLCSVAPGFGLCQVKGV